MVSKGSKFCFREIKIISILSFAVFIFIALISFNISDPGWSQKTSLLYVSNLEGLCGAYCSNLLFNAIGICAYFVPIFACIYSYNLYKRLTVNFPKHTSIGIILAVISLCALLSFHGGDYPKYPAGLGGWIGYSLSILMLNFLNPVGFSLFFITILVISISLITENGIGATSVKIYYKIINRMQKFKIKKPTPKAKEIIKIKPKKEKHNVIEEVFHDEIVDFSSNYIKPSLQLLDRKIAVAKIKNFTSKLEGLSNKIEEALSAFGVKAKVQEVHPGPVINQFELQLASGVKASKITNLSQDIARLLSLPSVRVVEIIPGKNTVGLELPNDARETVALKEIFESDIFQMAPSPLTLALGKDIAGKPIITDLGKMPHLLVAGTTGSGKSVGVNAMILSLLYKASPDEVKLVLIDPKMLELSVYQDIPHLLTPVVTDVQEAAGVLKWCVQEMERRYQLMSHLGVRNIAGYNDKIKKMQSEGNPIHAPSEGDAEPELLEALPYIVVVADEFADMMMVVGKAVEQYIARIAQKARAAGIHLILATQRPSVDVITGLIKANIPTRIAFQVSSRIDSRTILDQQGAEQLLGAGDMLYLPIGANIPTRVHGAFVKDDEVHRVVKALKRNTKVEYYNLNTEIDSKSSVFLTDDEDDPLYKEAVEIVAQSRKASISSIQRRLRIGYNRAASLIEKMEEQQLIGPMKTGAPREIFIPEGDT